MTAADLALVGALIFAWGVMSARLERADITAPITFIAAGLLLSHPPLAALGISPSPETVRALAEATLVLVLFADASRVDLRTFGADWTLYARLLGVGLPLTIGLGTLLAFVLLPGSDIWLALLVGAALAPTDAALGAGMILNPLVPARIRRLINVESGLNDGIATPFVAVALAGAATAEHAASPTPLAAVAELAIGLLVGVAVGGAGGWLLRITRRRGWAATEFAGPAVLALAGCAYASSLALHGNGFIAAFTGGLAFGSTAGQRGESLMPFVEDVGGLVSLLVWLAFGVVAVGPAFTSLTWQTALYAVLSLTVVRMAPVALALAGSGLGRTAAAFLGWFGPRGLASVVFGLLALEELGKAAAKPAVTAIAVTVVLSVIAHGVTADPLARRYGPKLAPARHDAEAAAVPEMPVRRLTRKTAPPSQEAAGITAGG
ncbi:MAG: cation:proton antiporter [Streptosporangiaceae bacterium]|nr:cation:proton antiporter [Streptosporangiaceae bacterium]